MLRTIHILVSHVKFHTNSGPFTFHEDFTVCFARVSLQTIFLNFLRILVLQNLVLVSKLLESVKIHTISEGRRTNLQAFPVSRSPVPGM